MTAQIAQLTPTNELKIGIDVGSIKHSVAISDEFGNIIKEFEITHTNKGFEEFFKTIETLALKHKAHLSIAMEGYKNKRGQSPP